MFTYLSVTIAEMFGCGDCHTCVRIKTKYKNALQLYLDFSYEVNELSCLRKYGTQLTTSFQLKVHTLSKRNCLNKHLFSWHADRIFIECGTKRKLRRNGILSNLDRILSNTGHDRTFKPPNMRSSEQASVIAKCF